MGASLPSPSLSAAAVASDAAVLGRFPALRRQVMKTKFRAVLRVVMRIVSNLRSCLHPRVAREPLAPLRHTPHQRTLRPFRAGSLTCRVGSGLGGGRGGARAAGGGGAAGAHRADLLVRRLMTTHANHRSVTEHTQNIRKSSAMTCFRHVLQGVWKVEENETRHVKSAKALVFHQQKKEGWIRL